MTQVELAAKVGVKQPSISGWANGAGPRVRIALAVATQLGVCVEWLYTGRGPKYPGDPLAPGLDELAMLWPRLDDDTKRDMLGAARLKARPFGKGAPPDLQASNGS